MVHLFKESHLEDLCPSCRTKHKCNGNGGWKPEFWRHEHYKVCECPNPECDYKIFLKTDEFHSGHY